MARFNLTINRQAADITAAIVRNAGNLEPVSTPQLVIGAGRDIRLTIVSGGSVDPISGDPTVFPWVSVGTRCAYPESGTYTLVFGGDETTNINHNATPAAVQAALVALPSIGAGNVSVSGIAGEFYQVEFTGDLADTNVGAITIGGNTLQPTSNVSATTFREGGSGEN
jgi:hypothetical protein